MIGVRYFFPALLMILGLVSGPAAADLVIEGQADIARVSGARGERALGPKEISRGKAGVALTIFYRDGISCGVALEGRRLGANANFETEKLSFCSGGRGRGTEETADARYREHLVGFRVCTARDDAEGDPARIGKFEIAAVEIDENGLVGRSGRTERSSGPSCGRWGRWSSCDENFVVTGFVAHFNAREPGSMSPDVLVGLQAVCREVTVR